MKYFKVKYFVILFFLGIVFFGNYEAEVSAYMSDDFSKFLREREAIQKEADSLLTEEELKAREKQEAENAKKWDEEYAEKDRLWKAELARLDKEEREAEEKEKQDAINTEGEQQTKETEESKELDIGQSSEKSTNSFNSGAKPSTADTGATASGNSSGPSGKIDSKNLTAGINEVNGKIGGISSHNSLVDIIIGWTNFLLPFVSVLAILGIIIGGILMITGFADEGNYEKGKKILIYSVIGIIIIFSAYPIVATIISVTSSS